MARKSAAAVKWTFDVGMRRDIGRKLGRLRIIIDEDERVGSSLRPRIRAVRRKSAKKK